MGAGTHARAGAVGEVGCSARAFEVVEVPLDGEGLGGFEVDGVEVGGPCILGGKLACEFHLRLFLEGERRVGTM